MKKLLSGILTALMLIHALFLPTVAMAQADAFVSFSVITDYDLDSTTPIFPGAAPNAKPTGTGTESGVFSVSRFTRFNVNVYLSQLAVTGGVEARLLCRVSGDGNFQQVRPVLADGTVTPSYVTLSAVGGWFARIDEPWHSCKVATQINSADDGNDLTTNLEKLNIRVGGR